MTEDRLKDLSELPDLNSLRGLRSGLPDNWSFSKGHNLLNNFEQWAVVFTHEDLSQDIYPLPLWVSVLAKWERDNGRQNVINSFKSLLDLD